MINNPMISDFVRNQIPKYPKTLQDVFQVVNQFAYDATHTIEGPLGEGYGGRTMPFDYPRLVTATSDSIRAMARSRTSMTGIQLRRALADAALSDDTLDRIIAVTEQEAQKRIDQATSEDRTKFHEHGHHGRQYIARNTVSRVMREVIPLVK
jgi:hypothetical protein